MSHAKAKPPASPGEECQHTHKDLIVESLTVRKPGSAAGVTILSGGSTTGLWVSTGQGSECIGLIADKHTGPYLVMYGQRIEGSELPPVAICPDHIQIPDAADRSRPIVISYADLLRVVREVQAPDAV